jgi:hypothetical protein
VDHSARDARFTGNDERNGPFGAASRDDTVTARDGAAVQRSIFAGVRLLARAKRAGPGSERSAARALRPGPAGPMGPRDGPDVVARARPRPGRAVRFVSNARFHAGNQ